MKHFETKLSSKSSEKFYCEKCNYSTCRNSQYIRHLSTAKHTNMKNETNLKQNSTFSSNIFNCNCNLSFNSRTSLWRHQKKCNQDICTVNNIQNEHIYDIKNLTNLVLDIVKQNKDLSQHNCELTNKIVDICKNNSNTITNITNTNSNNKTFNLNVFLNETCKDAMNLTDFVNSIKLQLSDLEKVGELGYIEGLYSIILKNLNALDITERPVHCTDKKRETMYIKDEDKWEKEDEKKARLHKMIRKVANKNIDLISDFKTLYPDWKKSTSKVSDQFNKIVIESMGGAGDNEYENEEKIIKKLAKEVYIDKIHL
jgi:hypothetical protein